jgi:hypothetical protein
MTRPGKNTAILNVRDNFWNKILLVQYRTGTYMYGTGTPVLVNNVKYKNGFYKTFRKVSFLYCDSICRPGY